jgi:sialic acid synthase SpsE
MEQREVKIGSYEVGETYPVRISAEIGTYFGKDLGLAKEYINVAKEEHCEFLKSEVLHDLSIIHDSTMTHTYLTDDGFKNENYRQLLKRKQNTLEEYEKIFSYAMDQGMPVIASVYDFEGVDFLKSIGAAAAKVATINIANRPLIEHCAKSGLPLIIDTGNAYLDEIASAVRWAEDSAVNGLVLHHRPDGSPCPPEKHNMRILKTLSETFGWPTGLSCHYAGDEMIYLSIGMGARIIEKPLYHKDDHDDQDTMYVMSFNDFREMVRKVRNCSLALGGYTRHELDPVKLSCRPCLVTKKHISKGSKLSWDNVRFAWPMAGISAEHWNDIEGRETLCNIKAGTPIQWNQIKINFK